MKIFQTIQRKKNQSIRLETQSSINTFTLNDNNRNNFEKKTIDFYQFDSNKVIVLL